MPASPASESGLKVELNYYLFLKTAVYILLGYHLHSLVRKSCVYKFNLLILTSLSIQKKSSFLESPTSFWDKLITTTILNWQQWHSFLRLDWTNLCVFCLYLHRNIYSQAQPEVKTTCIFCSSQIWAMEQKIGYCLLQKEQRKLLALLLHCSISSSKHRLKFSFVKFA